MGESLFLHDNHRIDHAAKQKSQLGDHFLIKYLKESEKIRTTKTPKVRHLFLCI